MIKKSIWKERRFRKIVASLGGKIRNTDDLTGGKEPSLLFCLWGGLIGKMLDDNWRSTRIGLCFRRILHPFITLSGKKFLSNPQVMENRN